MFRVHDLDGCAPSPLAHYLKAIAVLRLLAEQADCDVRGWWDGDRFRLATKLTKDELETFFLNDYRPTPLVSPWNKGAGFFQCDPALSSIENSKSPRFEEFRSAIHASRSRLGPLAQADGKVREIKGEAKQPGMSAAEKDRIKNSEDYKSRLSEANKRFKQLKDALQPELRLNWRGRHREWMDAAVVLDENGKSKFPALLGTGGNDGRLDFTNNFMTRIGEVFDLRSDSGEPYPRAIDWMLGALWGVPTPGCLQKKPIGQYFPGNAGGANNSNGPDSDSIVNPVDFILMLEGTIAFTSHATRRFGSSDESRVASPFTVDACGAAYLSASVKDEGARGEQWMPLWWRPLSYLELRRLLAEGRAQIGRLAVREPLDFAKAVKRLGTARGIRSFQRYGYIERNGQSNLAVPLGRFEVSDGDSRYLSCLDDLDSWLRRLRRQTRGPNASARLATVEKSLTDTLIAVTKRPDEPRRWQLVLSHLASVEQIVRGMASGATGIDSNPLRLPDLRPEWVLASDDRTPEFRLALAFALQAGRIPGGVRRHWFPLDSKQTQPEVVMHGRRGLDDCVALVERCLVEALQSEGRRLPLKLDPKIRAAASTADLTELIVGGVDLDHTLTLARALMALDRVECAKDNERFVAIKSSQTSDWPDDAWLAIRLCTLPWPLKTETGLELDIGTDPRLIRRLASGDAAIAIAIALQRLGAAGVRCTVRAGAASPDTARRWAAALAFPITRATAKRFLNRLDRTWSDQ